MTLKLSGTATTTNPSSVSFDGSEGTNGVTLSMPSALSGISTISAGTVTATTKFVGALEGNANSATALTSNGGSDVLPIYFSNGKKLVEIQVTPEDAITIADAISQISVMSAEKGESCSTMSVLTGITNKKALLRHTEVNDEN